MPDAVHSLVRSFLALDHLQMSVILISLFQPADNQQSADLEQSADPEQSANLEQSATADQLYFVE